MQCIIEVNFPFLLPTLISNSNWVRRWYNLLTSTESNWYKFNRLILTLSYSTTLSRTSCGLGGEAFEVHSTTRLFTLCIDSHSSPTILVKQLPRQLQCWPTMTKGYRIGQERALLFASAFVIPILKKSTYLWSQLWKKHLNSVHSLTMRLYRSGWKVHSSVRLWNDGLAVPVDVLGEAAPLCIPYF